ncbi:hypothetical protein CLV51_1085 [Chitinophaga niastensis]|uniref:Uncharacterized protein n=2 Tax=Chitinophaga niastensis TaxID=536980 RepID=A0A2P8HAR3_CHINA|nr:hypothetical protein CLV51_1085 [Chitinophaga niastensis]
MNTAPAEKSLRQAENSLNSSTGKIPQRKINAVQEAKSTLNRQVEANATYNLTGESAKAAGGRTVVNETRKAAENSKSGRGSAPLNPVNAPPPSDNTKVIKPLIIR